MTHRNQLVLAALLLLAPMAHAASHWADDLTPISAADWNSDRAAHLLLHENASFEAAGQLEFGPRVPRIRQCDVAQTG